jgi:hypothetical protein
MFRAEKNFIYVIRITSRKGKDIYLVPDAAAQFGRETGGHPGLFQWQRRMGPPANAV